MPGNENIYRFSVAVLFLMLALTGIYHRTKAAHSGEKIIRRKEGLFLMIVLRFFGFSMWLGLILYMVNPRLMSWSSLALPSWLRWTGAGLALLAIPLLYWMFSNLGKNITDTVHIRTAHQLVTSGPYRYIRHPMYLFSVIYINGISLLAASWFIYGSGIIAFLMLVMRLPIEEAELIDKFGDKYHDYIKNTGRFLPKFNK